MYLRSGGLEVFALEHRGKDENLEKFEEKSKGSQKERNLFKKFLKIWSWELACAGKPFVKSFERGISMWMEEDFFSEYNLFINRFFSL